jgi:hypothetical protein
MAAPSPRSIACWTALSESLVPCVSASRSAIVLLSELKRQMTHNVRMHSVKRALTGRIEHRGE